jgi:hypothetical protein
LLRAGPFATVAPMRRWGGSSWLAALLLAGLSGGGCMEDCPVPHVVALEGAVHSIDLAHRTVNVRFKLDDSDRELDRVVEVTKDTEIMINGALARLEDVRLGEKATGAVKIVDDQRQKRYLAVRVRIERSDSVPASGPTTRTVGRDGPSAAPSPTSGPAAPLRR